MSDELKWEAVTRRDAASDGKFLYGVMTSRVYCRPSCPSRLPLRKNVRFYDDATSAERDGLRACRRCRPLDTTMKDRMVERIRSVCRYIDGHAGERLTLATLSAKAHLSAFHFQRTFKDVIGITPKQYVEAARVRALKTNLRQGRSATDAAYDSGFGSGSRVYERVDTRLGMTPKQYREGGKGTAISYAVSETPLGLMMIGATDRGLCFLQFDASRSKLLERLTLEYPSAQVTEMNSKRNAHFEAWMKALGEYLAGNGEQLDLPLDVRGTAFQMKVWNYLQRIPYGHVQSYAEVAQAIGAPKAVRAVANACASNHVALVIPCHRVIRGDGTLGGYRWGLDRKRTLIDTERRGAADSHER